MAQYAIRVWDGPAGGGGDVWPLPPVETVEADTAREAVGSAVEAVRRAAIEAASAYDGDEITLTVRAEAIDGGDTATRELAVRLPG